MSAPRLAVASVLLVGACEPAPGFNDFTFEGPLTHELFDAESEPRSDGSAGLKFLIQHFSDDTERHVVFHDRDAYRFHDEWYYFRLLNGQEAPAADTEPVDGLAFDHIDDIYGWARDREPLPLDLEWIDEGDRLVSDHFYVLAHRAVPRPYGSGLLIVDDDRWMFRLSYRDPVTEAELVDFFRFLEPALPADVELLWLPNGDLHRPLADSLVEQGGPYAARIALPG